MRLRATRPRRPMSAESADGRVESGAGGARARMRSAPIEQGPKQKNRSAPGASACHLTPPDPLGAPVPQKKVLMNSLVESKFPQVISQVIFQMTLDRHGVGHGARNPAPKRAARLKNLPIRAPVPRVPRCERRHRAPLEQPACDVQAPFCLRESPPSGCGRPRRQRSRART
jgi:hypothetical protein